MFVIMKLTKKVSSFNVVTMDNTINFAQPFSKNFSKCQVDLSDAWLSVTIGTRKYTNIDMNQLHT